MKICFVLPAKNEEFTIENVIEEINNISIRLFNIKSDIVIVSDSTDKTNEKVEKIENVKLIISNNSGLGRAMYVGLKYASKLGSDYICSIDSDGQVDLNEIKLFYETIHNSEYDIIIGSRFLKNELIKYNYKISNRFGTILLKSIINLLTNYKVTDSHGGIRIMRKKVAQNLKLLGNHTYVQETLIDAYENNFNLLEIPSKWLVRNHGVSKVVRSKINYILNVFPVLFCRSNLHKKIFYPISIILFVVGLANMFFYNFTNGILFSIFSFVLINFAFGIEQYMHIIFTIKEKDNN